MKDKGSIAGLPKQRMSLDPLKVREIVSAAIELRIKATNSSATKLTELEDVSPILSKDVSKDQKRIEIQEVEERSDNLDDDESDGLVNDSCMAKIA